MCLWIENIIPKVAKDNITCYKVCTKLANGNYISLFAKYKYEILEKYDNNIPLVNDVYFYRHFRANSVYAGLAVGPNLFHSYKIRHYPGFNSLEVCIRCIIPKGAYYWEDKDEYASSQIIIMGEV